MMLSRNLEAIIHSPVNVNMYLTPGAGKKALNRHYDTHDVFVLQVHGRKMWRLYDPPFAFPLEYIPLQRYESMREMKRSRLDHDLSARDSCVLSDEFILNAGDCLYLPRGFWHEAESRPDEVSCHLTVGIQPITYLDVMSVALSQAALSDTRLREPLPFGFAASATAGSTVSARIAQIVGELPAKLDAETALGKIADHSLRAHKTGFQNGLLGDLHKDGSKLPGEDSRLYRREGLRCRVDESTTPVRMTFGSNLFELAPAYEEACRFISNARSFSVSELPGNLAVAEKVALVQQLINEGLLTTSSLGTIAAGSARESANWLPIYLDRHEGTIKWLDFRARPLTEPFFQQSIRQLKKDDPNARTRVTKIRALDDIREEHLPSGFIFHISRCGSTLLSNGLRAISGAVVISEAQPIGEAVASLSKTDPLATENSDLRDQSQDHLLLGLVRAYGHQLSNENRGLLIKFSSWNILQISAIRKLWPQVPCVIVVRDPLEVAVSCLDEPPGWMRWKNNPRMLRSMFSWDAEAITSMPAASFCARVLGEFLRSAASGLNMGCRVIDYGDLNASTVVDVAQIFGMNARDEDIKNIEKCFLRYSKDFSGTRVFIEDRESKQAKATRELRKEIQTWAQQAYDDIVRNRCNSE